MNSKFLKLYNLIMEEIIKNENELSILDLKSRICQLIESELKNYIINKKEKNNLQKCQIIYQISNDINRNEFMDKLYDICVNSNLINKDDIIKDEYSGNPDGFSFIKSTGCKKVILLNSIGFVAKGGGGTRKNSTINSNLTELIPCLLFYNDSLCDNKIDENFISELIKIAESSIPNKNIFLDDQDKLSAINTLNSIDLSDSSHLIKIKSGIKIYNYIKNHPLKSNDGSDLNLKNCWWCYRKKPENVSPSNPSDIIIEIDTKSLKKYIGYSLKSGNFNVKTGKETTFEPKLNSYIEKILRDDIKDETLLNNFSKTFNENLKQIFSINGQSLYNIQNLPEFNPHDMTSLNEWKEYKVKNKNELRKISIDNKGYRHIQKIIIDFFIKNFNNKNFKSFFTEKCLGIMSEKDDDWKYFIDNGFFVIKANEKDDNLKNSAFNITPQINGDSIEIKEVTSLQSFIVKYNNKNYRISIRTCQGNGFLELPNLRFSVQDDKEDQG